MLTQVQRIRIYVWSIVGAVLIGGIILNVLNARRAADVHTLTALRTFAFALERYKSNQWRYPEGTRIDLRKTIVLSDAGFAAGSKEYFRGSLPSKRTVTYEGGEEEYTISFTLNRTWPGADIRSRKCTISTNAVLRCAKE